MTSKQMLFVLLVAAFAIISVLGRPTQIVDSSLKENPPTGVIRVRFPSNSGLEEVEIFNRMFIPSGGMKGEPSQKHQEREHLDSKGKDQSVIDSVAPSPDQKENLEQQFDPNQTPEQGGVVESEQQPA